MTNPFVMPRRSDLRSDKKGANRSQFSGLHNQLPSIRRNMLETAGSIPYDEAQVQLVGRRPDEQRVLPQSESALASAWLQDAANRSNWPRRDKASERLVSITKSNSTYSSVRGASESFHSQSQPRRDLPAELQRLQRFYTLTDDLRAVEAFLNEHPAVPMLLFEATEPLRKVFGAECRLTLEVQLSDEDAKMKCIAHLGCSFSNPEDSLERFDSEWWINNCQRSDGSLVFDYEMHDGI